MSTPSTSAPFFIGALCLTLMFPVGANATIPDRFQCELRHIAFATQGHVEISDDSEGAYAFDLPAKSMVFRVGDAQEKVTKIQIISRTKSGAKIQQKDGLRQSFYVTSTKNGMYFSAVSASGMIFALQAGPCR